MISSLIVRASVPCGIVFLTLLMVLSAGCASVARLWSLSPESPPVLLVGVSLEEVHFALQGRGPSRVEIRELDPWQVYAEGEEYAVVWSGDLRDGGATIPREGDGGKDRLYRQFLLVEADSGMAFGPPQFVTDLSRLPVRTHELFFPEDIKGITCTVDLDDVVELGVRHANGPLDLRWIIDWSNPHPVLTHRVDGAEIPIDPNMIAVLDGQYAAKTHQGILYTPVLVNYLPPERHPENPLIHPKTDMENNPMGLGAFNMANEEGVRAFIAAMEFMVERYTRESAEHGQIAAMVIGNELQMHWTWHNMGNAPADQVIREYMLSLRLADLAARSIHRDFKVYNSMTHHWSISGYLNDPLKEISGIELLEGMLEAGKAQGDFPWHVAFHPYPENLFEPAWWNDQTATHRFDTPRVTFKNLEVLIAWLEQERYLYRGEPRRIMLSEQGFHLGNSAEAEDLQAAAYAASWVKVSQLPLIDAYHLHRHVHHPDEGGLNLGVREATLNPDGTWTLGDRHRIWHVMQAAGTPREEEAFAFALDVIGVDSWDAFAPNFEIDRDMREESRAGVLFSLYDLAGTARVEGIDRVYFETLIRDGGFPANAIFQHPPESGDGRLIFELDLPEVAPGRRLTFVTDTAMKISLSEDGVGFRVEVDGEEKLRHHQITVPPIAHQVDLTPYSGRTIELVLITNPSGNMVYDWSIWVQPRILEEEARTQ